MLEARERVRLNQVTAAKAIGISQSNLSDLEGKAEGSAYTPQAALVYGCNPHWLATGHGKLDDSISQPPVNLDGTERALLEAFRRYPASRRQKIVDRLHAESAEYREIRAEVARELTKPSAARAAFRYEPNATAVPPPATNTKKKA